MKDREGGEMYYNILLTIDLTGYAISQAHVKNLFIECESHYFEVPGKVIFLQTGRASTLCRVPQLFGALITPCSVVFCQSICQSLVLISFILQSGTFTRDTDIVEIQALWRGLGVGEHLRRQNSGVRFGNVQNIAKYS